MRGAWNRRPIRWKPRPIDTTGVELPDGVTELIELLAEHAHDTWAQNRLADGWRYGRKRSDWRKRHPDLVPYADLSEGEKKYDRDLATETLKLITKLGFVVTPRDPAGP